MTTKEFVKQLKTVLLTDGGLLVSKAPAPQMVKDAGWDDGLYIAPNGDEKEVFFVAVKKV